MENSHGQIVMKQQKMYLQCINHFRQDFSIVSAKLFTMITVDNDFSAPDSDTDSPKFEGSGEDPENN